MSNWKHLLQDCEEVIKLFDDLMEDLEEISASVDKRNEEPPHKSQVFNPKFLETSVSVQLNKVPKCIQNTMAHWTYQV